jgi:hypothetical protein
MYVLAVRFGSAAVSAVPLAAQVCRGLWPALTVEEARHSKPTKPIKLNLALLSYFR